MRMAYVHGVAGVTALGLLGALLDAGASLDAVQTGWRALDLVPAELTPQRLTLPDCTATSLAFTPPPHDTSLAHATADDLQRRIERSAVSPTAQQRLLTVLHRFADAVDRVHGGQDTAPVLPAAYMSDVVFLGSGVVFALEELGIDQCVAAPLNLGGGSVQRRPVPYPLVVELVRGIPVYGESIAGERTTVGGAAIITALAANFGPLPSMTVTSTGYGIAATEASAIPLQILLGESETPAAAERIAVLEANIDDMNPEFYDDIAAHLFAHGALDVTLTPLFMKKNRPANTLTVLAPRAKVSELSRLMLRHTSTFGVRVYEVWRQKLERFMREVTTCYGPIAVKCGMLDGHMVQAAPEYDDCKRAALAHDVPVRLVYAEAARLTTPWLTGEPG